MNKIFLVMNSKQKHVHVYFLWSNNQSCDLFTHLLFALETESGAVFIRGLNLSLTLGLAQLKSKIFLSVKIFYK